MLTISDCTAPLEGFDLARFAFEGTRPDPHANGRPEPVEPGRLTLIHASSEGSAVLRAHMRFSIRPRYVPFGRISKYLCRRPD
ncbi:hypothetical protein AW168_05955 [Nocardia brasiliensis]|uniref:Uncharacterized protein n=1 Tax=Nocardia brasiliensis (strain ATCC 700358 / HUJEG-1) TaxID=1133849 RepID=K0F362_NOCB7|nr:hypothetical protein O3I_031065 [Nocardia brasiliensis ATCC 700358]OCF91323.1 hypothetical protein AW168_05955 [Nocardia brasiliensis]